MVRWSLPLIFAAVACKQGVDERDDTGFPVDDSSTPPDDTGTPPDDSATSKDDSGDDTGNTPVDTAHEAPDTVQDYASAIWYGNEGDRIGGTLKAVGDVSGDGATDLAIGAPLATTSGAPFFGRAYIVTPNLSEDPIDLDAGDAINGNFALAHLAWDIGGQLDANHDGQDDLLLGSYLSWATGALDGAGDLYLGPVAGGAAPDVRFLCDEPHAESGLSVESLGDITDDGADDFAVGSPGSGTVYIVAGDDDWKKAEFLSDIGTRIYGAGTYLGEAMLGGDWTGDGVADLVAGTSQILSGPATVYVFEGPVGTADILPDDAAITIQPTTLVMQLTLANAGDTDGDGTNDLAVGLPNDETTHGAVQLYTSLTDKAAARFVGDSSIGQLGLSMEGVGDANADGFDDLALGAPSPLFGDHRGTVAVENGPFTGTITVLPSIWIGETGYDELGFSLAGLGDANGDGDVDLAVGAPEFRQDSGGVYLLSGWSARSRRRRPRS
jgi:hypothetical protein